MITLCKQRSKENQSKGFSGNCQETNKKINWCQSKKKISMRLTFNKDLILFEWKVIIWLVQQKYFCENMKRSFTAINHIWNIRKRIKIIGSYFCLGLQIQKETFVLYDWKYEDYHVQN